MGFRRIAAGCVLLLVCILARVQAQDTRSVVEPHYPPICKILYADLTPHDGTLPDEPIERHYRDNARIDKAIGSCAAGTSVILHSSKTGKSVFLIGPLRLRAGVILVVDRSASLWASRDPRDYDVQPGSCGVLVEKGVGCKPLLLAEDAPHSGVMGDGVIDGRGGQRMLVSSTGAEQETWWELAQRARLNGLTRVAPALLVVRRSNDFTLYNVTLRNSAARHVGVEGTSGFTAWAVRLDTPRWARGTVGVSVEGGSSNVSVIASSIRSGGPAVALRSAGAVAVSRVTLQDVHVYEGRGFDLGPDLAGGVRAVRASGLTFDGADYGLRIHGDQTGSAVVNEVRLQDVCLRNVPSPIVLNPGLYATGVNLNPNAGEGGSLPIYSDIELHNVHAMTAGTVALAGQDAAHRAEVMLDNVVIEGVRRQDVTARHAVITLKQGNVDPTGEDVRLAGSDGGGTPNPCTNRFVPFPVNAVSPGSAELIPPPDTSISVTPDGSGDFTTVQAALAHLGPAGGVILISPGIYRERLAIQKAHVTLQGASPDASRVVLISDEAGPGATREPATLRVSGDDFHAQNLTIESSGGAARKRVADERFAPALALTGDRNVLRNVRLLGSQGALYAGARNCALASGTSCGVGRTYIGQSLLAGGGAVISGDGLLYCDDCELHASAGPQPPFLTAQGKHYAAQESGFILRNARVTADPAAVKVLLGKPWRDLASVVFLAPQLAPQVDPAGFGEWKPGSTHRLDTAFFRVFRPGGPGAPTSAKQLTPGEAAHDTPQEVLGGKDAWDPTRIR